jgi:hypothetical protein
MAADWLRYRRIEARLREAFSKAELRRGVMWAQHHVPPGMRSILGVLLVIAGCFGFLPILGFWMIPLGGAFITLDIPPLRRRLLAWLDRSGNAAGENHTADKESRER